MAQENVVVVRFTEPSKAYQALSELNRVGREGKIDVKSAVLLERSKDGTVRTPEGADDAAGFYAVHRQRPFFKSLCTFMTQGPCIPMVLEADNAIQRWRELMGATDPAKADAGTLRKEFGSNIERNATHGSDASDTAAFELGYFFRNMELL